MFSAELSSSSGTKASAPLWIIIIAQAVSTVGDAFGQRCSRIHYQGSRRHMFIAISVMNFVSLFFVLVIAQLALPRSVAGAVYISGSRISCYREIDIEHDFSIHCTPTNCTAVDCPRQGPTSATVLIYYAPLLLIAGVINWAYYIGEIFLYKEALGILFLVLASLGSSFLVPAVMWMFAMPAVELVAWPVYVLGIVGSLLCTFENIPLPDAVTKFLSRLIPRRFRKGYVEVKESAQPDSPAVLEPHAAEEVEEEEALVQKKDHPAEARWKKVKSLAISSLRVLIPFFVLAIAYALWFCLQKIFNDRYHLNAFSFTFIDKVFFILYVIPFIFVTDKVPFIKRLFEKPELQSEGFIGSFVSTWKESIHPWYSMLNLFIFRLLINARSFIYFYLAVLYDINTVYLTLTLIRILFSWLGVICVVLFFRKFIGTSIEERKRVFSPVPLFLKIIGSVLIFLSLLMLNGNI